MTNENRESKGNLLFQWMCANRSGRIDTLIEAICWFNDGVKSYAAKQWISALSSLGHCDVDWQQRSWRIASPRLIRLPKSDGTLAFAGYRESDWGTAVINIDAYMDDSSRAQVKNNLDLPQSVFFVIDSNDHIKELTEVLKAKYIPNAAENIAASLKNLSSLSLPSRPPAFDTELYKLRIEETCEWVRHSSSSSLLRDGIYRIMESSGKSFFEKQGKNWKRVDSSTIHLREFSRMNRTPFEYVEDPARPGMGDLYVPDFINFPMEHLRALTMCSGRIAEPTGVPNEICFSNIPVSIFEKVSFVAMH